jgi:hypothetical protein
MKKLLFLIFPLLVGCGGSDSNIDSNANNIQIEKEDTSSKEKPAITINEDLSIDNSVITDLPSDMLKETISSLLQAKGKSLNTINSDGSIYIIASASTAVPVNSSGFIASRNIAFSKAEMRAKTELLRLTGEVITSERNSSLISRNKQGNDPDAVQKASFIEKVSTLADKSIDKALKELGVSDTEISTLNQSQKEKRYNESFYNYTSSFVASMIKGVSVVKIAEGEVGNNDYQIAVCVKYSPEQQSEAAALSSLGATESVLNSNVVSKLKSLEAEKLMSKLGAQFFKDENGKRFVVGFGQSAVQKSDQRQSNFISIGRRKARLQAIENIKNLLAEDLVGKEIDENIEKITEFQDGEQSLYTESNYSELIQSKKSSIKMNTMNLSDWQGTHPVSNSFVVGTIVILTESNNLNFADDNQADSKKTKKSEYKVSSDIEGEEL